MVRSFAFLMIAAGSVGSAPALAQDGDYNGLYVGGSIGYTVQANDRGSSVLFDTNRNGSFGDTVNNSLGQNAFAPGFCGGRSAGANPNCRGDKDGKEYFGHVGADTQFGGIVVGVVGEFGKSEAEDAVTAFSSTPASYTLNREFRYNAGARGRVGFTPNNSTLFYATGGVAWAKIRNGFSTTNGVNAFTTNGNSDAWGYSFGGGVEQRVSRNLSFGVQYLNTTYRDDDFRVTAGPGTAGATNPFLLVNASGTDFRRSDTNFRTHSLRLTGSFRF